LKGEFARTVNMTDVYTGWVFTIAIRNNARVHMLAALDAAMRSIPYPIAALDCDYPAVLAMPWFGMFGLVGAMEGLVFAA
jgi:hypothetical protein